MAPSSAQARSTTCPGRTFRTDNTAVASPTPKADTDAGPSRTVRCPPTMGTSYMRLASCMPSSINSAMSAGAITVSRMASGAAPIAARSLTLASTAAKPVPLGSASTNGGNIASPPTTIWPPRVGTNAPSSPGPVSQSVGPNTCDTKPIGAFWATPAWFRYASAIRCSTVTDPTCLSGTVLWPSRGR